MKLRDFLSPPWKCWLSGHVWTAGYDPHRPIVVRYGKWEFYCFRSRHMVTIDYGEKEE